MHVSNFSLFPTRLCCPWMRPGVFLWAEPPPPLRGSSPCKAEEFFSARASDGKQGI